MIHISISSDISITPASSVKNLGVVSDEHLSFHEHITKVSQACFFHIRDLRRIRPFLTRATAATIGSALVQSKLKSLHWLKVKERIVYKTVSLTYKSIVTPGRNFMSHLLQVKQPAATRSSKLITLERPSIPS